MRALQFIVSGVICAAAMPPRGRGRGAAAAKSSPKLRGAAPTSTRQTKLPKLVKRDLSTSGIGESGDVPVDDAANLAGDLDGVKRLPEESICTSKITSLIMTGGRPYF